jgi:hypothetical protein
MTKQKRKRWVGVCLLGVALGATGCSVEITRAPPECCACGAGKPVTLPADPQDRKMLPTAATAPASLPADDATAAPVRPGSADNGPGLITSVAAAPGDRPPAPRPMASPAVAQAPEPASAVQVARAPEPSEVSGQQLVVISKPARKKKRGAAASRPVLTFEAAPAPPADLADAAPATLAQQVMADHGETARRGYIDLTVQPWFGYADDHSWLNGQLMHARATDTWKLHYASVDDADPYGGTVTLVGQEQLQGLTDGAYVKVHGSLADPDRREPGSPYHVDSFEVVERPK